MTRRPDSFGEHSRHVVVDLETLGTRASARLISLGACGFGGSVMPMSFYHVIALDGLNGERTVDDATLAWWDRQGFEAREALTHSNRIPLERTLMEFGAWLRAQTEDWSAHLCLWGNGYDFDLAILADAYAQAREQATEATKDLLQTPWAYYNGHNLRTLRTAFPDVTLPAFPSQRRHHALYDAQHEMAVLRCLLQARDLALAGQQSVGLVTTAGGA